MTTGPTLRDTGTHNVINADHAINRNHRTTIEDALNTLIDRGQPFTADDVHDLLPHDFAPHSANLLPAVMSAYRSTGRIVMVGFGTSTRPTRHGGARREWIGTGAPHPPHTPATAPQIPAQRTTTTRRSICPKPPVHPACDTCGARHGDPLGTRTIELDNGRVTHCPTCRPAVAR